MSLKVRKFNAQVRDSTTGNMIPAGLLSSDALGAIDTAKTNAIAAVQSQQTTSVNAVTSAGTAAAANFPATAAACDTLAGDFAATYVPDQAYAVGDYCTYQYQLYQCKTAIAANTDHTFVTSHWNLITVTDTINDQVDDLKTQIKLTNNGYTNIDTVFSHGRIGMATDDAGVVIESESYKYQAVTPSLIHFDREITIKCNSGYEFLVFYYDSEGDFLSRGASWIKNLKIQYGTYFRIFIRLDPADITANIPTDVFALNIYVDSILYSHDVFTDRNIVAANSGMELINTGFAHGRILTTAGHVGEVSVSSGSYKYQAITPDAVVFSETKTIKTNPGYAVQIWWYNENDEYAGRSANFVSEYKLAANRRYRFFVRLDPADITANVDVDVFQDNVCIITEVGERLRAVEDNPLSTLPNYILHNMAEKPLGALSKGYILLSFDDGANTLATGTIPLLIENNVPGTFGLLPQSEIFADGNETKLATVVDAVENHGCAVAMHGSALWPTYTESSLYDYLVNTIELFADNGLGDTYGAICPGGSGDDTSTLVKAVAGGMFGYLFSGNRADKISYDDGNADGKYNGARSNRFDLDRRTGIGITTTNAQDIVNYAAENHLLLCPFWHDNTLNDESHPEYITYFNSLISAAKEAGLTFITTKDLPHIT